MFRQFDIDYNKVTLDGVILNKPNYLSPKEWLEFWEQFDGETVDLKVSAAWDEGFKESENEHEKEIEDVKDFCDKELNKLAKLFLELVDDFEINKSLEEFDLDREEKIEKFIKEIDRSVDALWRL
jgi:hypothetical protein